MTCHLVNFTDPAIHWVKIKESKKINLARDKKKQQQKLWNMKVTVIVIVVSALRTVPKGLERSLEKLETRGRILTIKTTVLWRSIWTKE